MNKLILLLNQVFSHVNQIKDHFIKHSNYRTPTDQRLTPELSHLESDNEDEFDSKNFIPNCTSGQALNSLNPMNDFFKMWHNIQSSTVDSLITSSNIKNEEVKFLKLKNCLFNCF